MDKSKLGGNYVASTFSHPHFDENILVWSDEYSGKYPAPPAYEHEFELQWKLALEGEEGFFDNPGASTDDKYIKDRVYEWTGKHPDRKDLSDKSMGARVLDYPVDPGLIRGKECIDIGCGLGRWTRTMQMLGAASILSIDMSESALKSVARFNSDWARADIMKIPEEHPDWVERYDFACFWGVAMCTHDPQQAFLSASSTVKKDGVMYLMVYCPEGMHNTSLVNLQRRFFHQMTSIDERLAYLEHVYSLQWDSAYRIKDNVRNQLIRLAGLFSKRWKRSKVGYLDMLEPCYNWVIPKDVIDAWMNKAGFRSYTYLYKRPKSAYHILARK